jgi:hypothetical protein
MSDYDRPLTPEAIYEQVRRLDAEGLERLLYLMGVCPSGGRGESDYFEDEEGEICVRASASALSKIVLERLRFYEWHASRLFRLVQGVGALVLRAPNELGAQQIDKDIAKLEQKKRAHAEGVKKRRKDELREKIRALKREHLSFGQIARRLNMPQGTVKAFYYPPRKRGSPCYLKTPAVSLLRGSPC